MRSMPEDSKAALLQGSLLEGVRLRLLTVNKDPRGSITEVFYDTWGVGIDPAQWSVVESRARVLRGMHLHLGHDEYICVIRGRACVGFYDIRENSPTHRRQMLVELSGKTPACLTFPRGLLHGWYFYETSIHLQAVSETYENYCKDDNWGCRFDDPQLGIEWPEREPILSERSRLFPSLAELLAKGSRLAF